MFFVHFTLVCMPGSEDQLVAQYIPLVRRLAMQMVARLPANVQLEDLTQAGLMGLLDAIRRYTHNPDAQFETYATMRIRGAMLDELRSQDWLPRSVRTKARSIEHAVTRLTQQLMYPPSESEIADEMGLSLSEYQQLLEDAHGTQVLHYEDFGRGQDQESAHPLDYLVDSVQTASSADPFGNLVSDGLRQALVQAIERLPERERLLLSLQCEQDLTQKEIALVLQITEGRVSQIRSQAVARIRAALAQGGWQEKPAETEYQTLL